MFTIQTSGRGPRAGVELRPLHLAQLPALAAAAQADGHGVIAPTHAVMRGAEIVGYASLGRVRMFFAWLDSRKLSAAESYRAWRAAEAELTGRFPGEAICLPCTQDSPLLPFVERMGYGKAGTAHIYLRNH